MNIEFEKVAHEKLANDHGALRKKFNKKGMLYGDEIITVLTVLDGALSLNDVSKIYHPHPLKGNYKGYFAVDIAVDKRRGLFRMIFRPDCDNNQPVLINDYRMIKSVVIVEICKNYH